MSILSVLSVLDHDDYLGSLVHKGRREYSLGHQHVRRELSLDVTRRWDLKATRTDFEATCDQTSGQPARTLRRPANETSRQPARTPEQPARTSRQPAMIGNELSLPVASRSMRVASRSHRGLLRGLMCRSPRGNKLWDQNMTLTWKICQANIGKAFDECFPSLTDYLSLTSASHPDGLGSKETCPATGNCIYIDDFF